MDLSGSFFELQDTTDLPSDGSLTENQFFMKRLLSLEPIDYDECLVSKDTTLVALYIRIFQLTNTLVPREYIAKMDLGLRRQYYSCIGSGKSYEQLCNHCSDWYLQNDIFDIVTSDKSTAVMGVCRKGMESVAMKLIDSFGDKCVPEQVNKNGYTALTFACEKGMESVAMKLNDSFGEK